MENLLFIKIEICIAIFAFLYILFYLWEKIYAIFFKVKNIVNPVKIQKRKTALNKIKLNNKENKTNSKKEKKSQLSEENKLNLHEIIKSAESYYLKWYFDLAKNKIVEWLSLDKYNLELNLELASIYEKEKKYLNAEYIYKDLLDYLKVDFLVMKKLAYVYALQDKLKESLKMYEKIHNKKMSDDEVINILAELTFTMKYYKKAIKFAGLYLIWKPRDLEKLYIKAKSLEKEWKFQESFNLYKRILELNPYNTKAKNNYLKAKKRLENKK